jgi:hypothetical protein
MKLTALLLLFTTSLAHALPDKFTELLDYVQEAPDQAGSASCLYVASTGAMELIANKKDDIKNPVPYGKYDLAESFLIQAPVYESKGKYMWEIPVLKFNRGFGIHIHDWPYEPWDGTDESDEVWRTRDWQNLPHVSLPEVETIPLFVKGTRWSTNVLTDADVLAVKEALVTHHAPVLINYNDTGYWHVILIVGYDDNLPGSCYQITPEECGEQKGAFYVRDSFGVPVELRDFDWFRVKGNASFVVKEKK